MMMGTKLAATVLTWLIGWIVAFGIFPGVNKISRRTFIIILNSIRKVGGLYIQTSTGHFILNVRLKLQQVQGEM